MADIKIITRHGPSNYGSILQSIATLDVLKKIGHKGTIIDYQNKKERGIKAIVALIRKKENYNNPILKLLYIILKFPEEHFAQRKFDIMRRKYLTMTDRYTTDEHLSNIKGDIFMTGSDQVWGPTLYNSYDKEYFLSFVKSSKKIAYAASFGRTKFNEHIKEVYSKMLSKYDSITVREDSAIKLLKEMNINCIGQVLDPTLLLTSEDWEKYISKNISGKYVLVYQLHKNSSLNKYAKKFAEQIRLPLFRISPYLHQYNRGGKFIYLPDLGKFLSYIKNCTFLITDSFHGTAFAINFNKCFVEFLPKNKTGSRNQSLLRLTGLSDRIISDYNDFSLIKCEIDYSRVNNILTNERKKSISLLKNMIER